MTKRVVGFIMQKGAQDKGSFTVFIYYNYIITIITLVILSLTAIQGRSTLQSWWALSQCSRQYGEAAAKCGANVGERAPGLENPPRAQHEPRTLLQTRFENRHAAGKYEARQSQSHAQQKTAPLQSKDVSLNLYRGYKARQFIVQICKFFKGILIAFKNSKNLFNLTRFYSSKQKSV